MAEITRELREWAHGFNGPWKRHGEMLLAIADRIDEAHKSALASAYGEGAESVALPDLTGYVKLPVDADGEYIHFGDVLDQFGTPMTVFAMSDPDPDEGDCMLELITDGISDSTWVRARKMRHHHHAPTVEDVLREFVSEFNRDDTELCDEEIIERFAARLRLAGDAE